MRKYKKVDLKVWSTTLKRHAWWMLLLIIGLSGLISVNNLLSDIRSAEDDVKKRVLGENLLKLFNYLPNNDSIGAGDIFLLGEALVAYEDYLLPILAKNKQQQEEIKDLYPFLQIIPVTVIDSLQDFNDAEEAVLYFRHFDYTTLSMADSLSLYPKFYKCIDESNILQFRNFQIFSHFCNVGELPYTRRVLNYQYKKIDSKFLCNKYLFR
ncbi:MAG: hypothetical protein LBG80_06500 [Bacteroidales bacterium]|jgi:hypothetical protein|nr:hypothetical protein [Bacteroidales bacterium]